MFRRKLIIPSSDHVLLKLSSQLVAIEIRKDLIGWDLEELEAIAQSSEERDIDSDDEST